jgi:hypothetical protein
MKPKAPPAALCFSDAHFWHKPPVARSAEANWWEALDRNIGQLKELQKRYRPPIEGNVTQHELPIIFSGDLFDKWNPVPEIVNFLLGALPDEIYGVCGNHDLPNHNLEDFRRSGFCTLVKAGKVKLLNPRRFVIPPGSPNIRLWGASCGEEVRPIPKRDNKGGGGLMLDVIAIHDYVWKEGCGFPGADDSKVSSKWRKRLTGYDVAVFGDNHIPFASTKEGKATIINAGGFYRRKSDEVKMEPSVWLIRIDGTFERIKLDCSEDKFISPTEIAVLLANEGIEDFINDLQNLGDVALNFTEAIKQALSAVMPNESTRRIILNAMEKQQ